MKTLICSQKRIIRRLAVTLVATLVLVLFLPGCDEDDPVPALGKLMITPQEALINVNTLISATIKVSPGLDVGDTLRLLKIAGNQTTEIGFLFDNGDLSGSGDEIKGDGVFSGKIYLSHNSTGKIQLRARARVKGKDMDSEPAEFEVFNDLPVGSVKALLAIQNQIGGQLSTYLGGNPDNAPQAINQLVSWLNDRPEVASVSQNGGTAIEIVYTSGLRGGVIISMGDANGKSDTRGGFSFADTEGATQRPYPPRSSQPVIPMEKQTRGELFDTGEKASFNENTIGNRNVFIYSPFEAHWHSVERPHIINILDSLACGDFQVTSYIDQEANVARLYEMVNYGMVVLATHGAGGKVILTGEIADTLLPVYQTYKPMMQGDNPKMGISANIVIAQNGTVVTRANVYKVYDSFIAALPGTFPQSIIQNNSCQSDQTSALRDAFIGKGAKTYYGFTEIVNGSFCIKTSRSVMLTLARDNKQTSEVPVINEVDPTTHSPKFTMNGSGNMRYALDLMNGDFENLMMGWTKSGDGRVISQLGFVQPTGGNYMGIISTGLGYTTATGSLSQSFTIPANASTLSFNWNFLSEEFLEYIGSSYQDTFIVALQSEDFGEEILLIRTIDGIAAAFGASAPTTENPEGIAGDLIPVSPDIVFDRGGVYMTDWQSSSYDITAYRGKCVSLILRCTDVGDSIFDTAILLDDIKLN